MASRAKVPRAPHEHARAYGHAHAEAEQRAGAAPRRGTAVARAKAVPCQGRAAQGHHGRSRVALCRGARAGAGAGPRHDEAMTGQGTGSGRGAAPGGGARWGGGSRTGARGCAERASASHRGAPRPGRHAGTGERAVPRGAGAGPRQGRARRARRAETGAEGDGAAPGQGSSHAGTEPSSAGTGPNRAPWLSEADAPCRGRRVWAAPRPHRTERRRSRGRGGGEGKRREGAYRGGKADVEQTAQAGGGPSGG
jgi:hypothetical protein